MHSLRISMRIRTCRSAPAESAQPRNPSPDPFPRSGWGLGTRLRGGWTRPCDVRTNNIPQHGQRRNVWGKRFFLVVVFSRAPGAEFGESTRNNTAFKKRSSIPCTPD